jgi:hypothetical protein
VQQQQRGAVDRSGLAIKDVQAIHLHRAMMHGGVRLFRGLCRGGSSRNPSKRQQRRDLKKLQHDQLLSNFCGSNVWATRPKMLTV